MCKENSAPLKSKKGAIMAKKTATIEEKIQKLVVIEETLEYLERQIDYNQGEIDGYLQQATDEETGELKTDSWAYNRVEEFEAKKSAYEELMSDLEHLV